jgi:hypothetical protein
MINRNFFGTQEDDKGNVSINGVPSNFSFTDKSSMKNFSAMMKGEFAKSGSFDISQQSKSPRMRNISPNASIGSI